MICHHYKCVFVHIPKSGGQSIEHVFLNLLGLTWGTRAPLLLRPNDRRELGPPQLAHLKARGYVRYKYLTQEMFDGYFKFAFVRNPWSRMVSLYKYLGGEKHADFKTFLLRDLKNTLLRQSRWFVAPQYDFVYSRDGRLLVNYIGRFEQLQTDFNYVCEQIGLPPTQLPHVNQSTKSQNYAKYTDYYDQETIDCVADLYRRDIELFNYTFE